MKNKYYVRVEATLNDPPKPHEMHAAQIVANYFRTDITFLRPQPYRNPDLDVKGVTWELKSPIGNGKKTIENNLRNSHGQSHRVILDLTRCKLHQTRALSRIRYYIKQGDPEIKKLLVILKNEKIIVIL